ATRYSTTQRANFLKWPESATGRSSFDAHAEDWGMRQFSYGLFDFALAGTFAVSTVVSISRAMSARTTPPPSTRVVMLGTGTPNSDPERSGPAVAIVVGDET